MIRYSLADLTKAFSQVGIRQGDTVLVHSALFNFGVPTDFPLTEAPKYITQTLLETLGDDGTLVVPTFNFDFCKGQPFDRQNTPSKGMGVFAEFVRTHPMSTRSCHPIQSLAAVGRWARDICLRDTPSTYDKNGPIAMMIEKDAKLMLLGAPMQSASLVHYLEESFQVPYRYWKEFCGTYIDNGEACERNYKMYARDLTLNPKLNLSLIEDWLLQEGLLSSTKVGGGLVKVCTFSSFLAVAAARLKKDPLCLIQLY